MNLFKLGSVALIVSLSSRSASAISASKLSVRSVRFLPLVGRQLAGPAEFDAAFLRTFATLASAGTDQFPLELGYPGQEPQQ